MLSLESLEGRYAPDVNFLIDTGGDVTGYFTAHPDRLAALSAVLSTLGVRLSYPSPADATFVVRVNHLDLPPGVLGEAGPSSLGASGLPDSAGVTLSDSVKTAQGVGRVVWHELGHSLGIHGHLPAGTLSGGRQATMTSQGVGPFSPADWSALRGLGWLVSTPARDYSVVALGHVKVFDSDGGEALSVIPYQGYRGRVGVTLNQDGSTTTLADNGHTKIFSPDGRETFSAVLTPPPPSPSPPQGVPSPVSTFSITDRGGGVLAVKDDYSFMPFVGYRGPLTVG